MSLPTPSLGGEPEPSLGVVNRARSCNAEVETDGVRRSCKANALSWTPFIFLRNPVVYTFHGSDSHDSCLRLLSYT